MGLLGVYATIAAATAIAFAAIVYAVRRADALAWFLALTAVLSAAAFAASNWVALGVMPRDPGGAIALTRKLGPASSVAGVLFGIALVLVLVRDSKRPV